MSLSVSALNLAHAAGRVEIFRLEMPSSGGSIVFHPRYQKWLQKVGLDSASAILSFPAEVISGHSARHVAEITLEHGRKVFLKREHLVGWRIRMANWRDGFGFISRSEREAIMLQFLEELSLPAPQWLAYGTTSDGRAFLLVDELSGSLEWDPAESDTKRLTRIGETIAAFHVAGIGTPDLAPKHVFIHPSTGIVSLIDWQNAPRPGPVAWRDRISCLSNIASRLPTKDVTAFVNAYLARCSGPQVERAQLIDELKSKAIFTKAARSNPANVRLVWRDGESLVTVPNLSWPHAWDAATPTQKFQWSTFDPVGRIRDVIRCSPWRSPAAIDTRLLVQIQQANLPSPRLLAYGQDLHAGFRSRSFLLTDRPESSIRPTKDLVSAVGQLLRSAHDAGLRIRRGTNSNPIGVNDQNEIQLNAVSAWVRGRPSRLADDLLVVLNHFASPLSRTERLKLIRAYLRQGRLIRMSRSTMMSLVNGGA